MKTIIRLTESELHNIVKQTVNELKDILFILKWRYDGKVVFKFTGKTKCLEKCVLIQDIVCRDGDEISGYWDNRIRVGEHQTLSRVYINF